jgi:hypothetical protein
MAIGGKMYNGGTESERVQVCLYITGLNSSNY